MGAASQGVKPRGSYDMVAYLPLRGRRTCCLFFAVLALACCFVWRRRHTSCSGWWYYGRAAAAQQAALSPAGANSAPHGERHIYLLPARPVPALNATNGVLTRRLTHLRLRRRWMPGPWDPPVYEGEIRRYEGGIRRYIRVRSVDRWRWEPSVD